MEAASLRYVPVMESSASASLSRSFERHLRAKNLSDGTVASYLVGVRQFTAFLQPDGRGADRGHPRRPRGVHRQPAQPLVAGDCFHALQAAAGTVPLAGGRRGDRGQPDGAHEATRRARQAHPGRPGGSFAAAAGRLRRDPILTMDAPGFTPPLDTSLDHKTAQVEGDAEGRAKERREVTRGAVSGNLWQNSPVWPPESRGAAAGRLRPSQLAGDDSFGEGPAVVRGRGPASPGRVRTG